MEQIKKHDFIEVEYTGKLKEENTVFDTTDEKVAKEHHLSSNFGFGPVVICVGEQQILAGLDKNLENKEVGKEYEFDIKPEDAFGNKDPKLIQLIPTNKFKQQNIQPMPGMQMNIDGIVGTVKTVSGGRTLVDFNHPLAGKELTLGTNDFKSEVEDASAKLTLKTQIPTELQETLSKKISELIPSIKKVEFTIAKENKNK